MVHQVGDRPGQADRATPQADDPPGSARLQPPPIALPKRSGDIQSISEDFAAAPFLGAGALLVPIATSLSRYGFGLQQFFFYHPDAGNGRIGFGWNLSLQVIRRKTDTGLQRYSMP